MKILLINQCHYKRGGADVVYLNTGKLLQKFGHQISYLSTEDEKNIEDGINKYFIYSEDLRKVGFFKKIKSVGRYLYNKEAKKKLNELIKTVKPDVAHIHLFHGSISISVIDALLVNKIPIVHTVHDYRLMCPVNTFKDVQGIICEACIKKTPVSCITKRCSDGKIGQSVIVTMENIWHSTLKRESIKKINAFHFVSKFAKKKHEDYFPWIESKAKLLYNFTSPQAKFDLKMEPKHILYFGRLSREKGVGTLVKAYLKNTFRLPLKIVGEGPVKLDLESQTFKNEPNKIEFLGYKEGEELVYLIKNAYCVIVPSEWYENNPMTIIEAYSYGIPVIGSNIGGIPEIIQDNKTGLIFEPGNDTELSEKLTKILCLSNEHFLQMRISSFEFYERNFSEKVHYQKLLEIYNYAINNNNKNL